MGFFGSLVTDGSEWFADLAPDVVPRLRVTIHDSDIGILDYEPHHGGSGLAYVGVTPRTYFEDESTAPTDKEVEVQALVRWFHAVGVVVPELKSLLDHLLVEEGELAEGDFAEECLADFFEAVGLPWGDLLYAGDS